MADVVCKCNFKRESGWLYYLDKNGDVSRTKMARGKGGNKSKPEVVEKCGVKRQDGYLYFIDKQCNVARSKMARKGK